MTETEELERLKNRVEELEIALEKLSRRVDIHAERLYDILSEKAAE